MFKKRSVYVPFVFIVIMTITACMGVVRGSGNLITENRQVSGFDRIELGGSGELIITQDGSESVRVETDDNVMQYIEVRVENGTLKLGFRNNVNIISTTRLVFSVSVDDLVGVQISGSGSADGDQLETDRLDLSVSGSGNIQFAELQAVEVNANISGSGLMNLAGAVASQAVDISGSGSYMAGDLCSESIKISVSGSGNATVCATGTLDADISGSGAVNYYGMPAVNSSTSGSGSINHLGDK